MNSPDFSGIKVILLDIEGTTTTLDFVHKKLFSYAKESVEGFLQQNGTKADVKKLVSELKSLHGKHSFENQKPERWNSETYQDCINSASEFVRFLISQDSKNPALKGLQGLIWEEGYRKGALKGEVYSDVPPAMERWARSGIGICIYSSGSVLAQKLIFNTTEYGDLTQFISNFFDTAVGAKREYTSYARISQLLNTPPGDILFISDVIEEIRAAEMAGYRALLIERVSTISHGETCPNVIHNFNNLLQ